MITPQLQTATIFAIAPAKATPSPVSDNSLLGTFATALQNAAGHEAPVKADSAKTQTQRAPADASPSSLSSLFAANLTVPLPTQLLGPVVTHAAPPASAPESAASPAPNSPLPGKADSGDQSKPTDAPSPVDVRRQPTDLPLLFPREDGLPDQSAAPHLPLSSPVSEPNSPIDELNPADPLLRQDQSAYSESISHSAASLATEQTAELSGGPKASLDSSQPLPLLAQLGAPPAEMAGQPESKPSAEAFPVPVTSSSANAGAQTTGQAAVTQVATTAIENALRQPVSMAPANNPPRVLNTEARRVGSLPLRTLLQGAGLSLGNAKATFDSVAVTLEKTTLASPQAKPSSAFAPATQATGNGASPHSAATEQAAPEANNFKVKASESENADSTAPLPAPANNAPSVTQPASSAPSDSLPAVLPAALAGIGSGQNPTTQTATATPATPHPPTMPADTSIPAAAQVQSARVVQGVAQSEMHIGLRTPAFGSVEVHTAVRDTQLGLSVISERGDLHGFLAQEVPALQNIFHQQGLQFDQIRFVASAGSNAFSSGGQSQSDSSRNQQNPRAWFAQASAASEPEPALPEIQISSTRLSLLA